MGPRQVQVRRPQEALQAEGLSPEPGATAGRCLSWPGASLGIQGPPLLFPARLLKPDTYVLKEGGVSGHLCVCPLSVQMGPYVRLRRQAPWQTAWDGKERESVCTTHKE